MQGTSDPRSELLDASALCRSLVPSGSVELFLADHRKQLFPDEMFEDLFTSRRGRPSVPGDVIACVMVLQSLEGLSDREAARALADRISWKVACGLALDDGGFDHTVLTYWRARLRQSERPERIFDAVREVVAATGVLRGRTRRALDSTVLDDAVATQDTVTQLVAQIRRVRRLVPAGEAVPATVVDDGRRKPLCDWSDTEARHQMVHDLVTDATAILEAVAGSPLSEDQSEAVTLLAIVAGQDVEVGEDGRWRIARRVAHDRVISVHDPESRHAHKSVAVYRDGFKAHVSVEPATGLVTACQLSAANRPDALSAVGLLTNESEPLTVYADSAYGTGEVLATLHEMHHTTVIKPHHLHSAVPGGFTRDDFTVDEAAGTMTCPAGVTRSITVKRHVIFGAACRDCALRARCTTATNGRKVALTAHDAELVANRAAFRDERVSSDYQKWRPLVERSLAWVVGPRYRRVRYRGLQKNQFGLSTRVAAINLRRLVNMGLEHHGEWVLTT